VAAGIVAAAALHQEDGLPAADAFAGHSVGELTAAALAGVLSDEDAMRLVAVRSQAMATAAAAEPTSMAAVVGGTRENVVAAIEEDGPAKARVMPLQVAGAFHTPYMAGARDELAAFAPSLSPHDPSVPLISNAGGEVVGSGARYLELIVDQVASPVDWEACM